METTYADDRGYRYYVSTGISGGEYFITVRQRPGRGTHRVTAKSLPLRSTAEEAQQDLDRYAKKRGWEKL